MQDGGDMGGVTREVVSFARKVFIFDDSLFEGQSAQNHSAYENDNVPLHHYNYSDEHTIENLRPTISELTKYDSYFFSLFTETVY